MILNTKYSIWLRIYLLPVSIAAAGCFQLIFIDYPHGHDWIFELVRLEEYFGAIKAGQIFPYWADNLYRGLGSPIFLYYAPLYNILSSLIIALGIPLKSAAIITLTGLMVASAIGMVGLMWEINKNSTSRNILVATRITAVAYVLSPYLLSDMLVRNASAEFTALCLAPYPFWGLVMLKNNRQAGVVMLTIGLSLSILSHNLTALVITTMLLICAMLLFVFDKQYKKLAIAIFSIITAIGITAWFWLPAFFLKSEVSIQKIVDGRFDFHNNFSSLIDLFSYDYFYTAGPLPLVVLATGILLILVKNNKYRLPLLFLVTTSILFLFLQLPASTFIWEHVPFMPLFQFPWRMMGPFAFCMALLLGTALSQHKKITPLTELMIITLLVLNAIPSFNRYQPLPDGVSNTIPYLITPDGVRTKGLSATVLDEYMPHNVDKSIINKTSSDSVFLHEPPIAIDVFSIGSQHIHFIYNSEEAFTLYPSYWHFPTWHARLNDEPHPISDSPWGTLQLDLPAGNSDIELLMTQPAIRKTGFMISGFSFVVFCLLFICKMKRPLLT